jgi:hypothetical protein
LIKEVTVDFYHWLDPRYILRIENSICKRNVPNQATLEANPLLDETKYLCGCNEYGLSGIPEPNCKFKFLKKGEAIYLISVKRPKNRHIVQQWRRDCWDKMLPVFRDILDKEMKYELEVKTRFEAVRLATKAPRGRPRRSDITPEIQIIRTKTIVAYGV